MSLVHGSSPPNGGLDVWTLTQCLTESEGFPFVLHVVDIQVCVDYTASHHLCCWTRSMLHPLWEPLLASEVVAVKDKEKEAGSLLPLLKPQTVETGSLFSPDAPPPATRQSLRELSTSIQLLHARQQQQRTSSRGVDRLRYIHTHPPVIRVGKGISGTFTVTFSLQRCSNTGEASTAPFPSFLAIEPDGVTAPFVTISVLEVKRRSPAGKPALLILQSISSDGDVATYSALDAELNFSSVSLMGSCALAWGFRVYAAFYSSAEEQIRLDEPFMHLHDWAPRVKQQERFAVSNPNMDPDIVLSSEKKHRASIDRRIKSAMDKMDAAGAVEGSAQVTGAVLRHVATLQTSRRVSVELCTQPGNGTLAAVMKQDISWPLQLMVGDATGRTWCTSSIAGSSSLERLAREIGRLEEQIGGVDDEQM